MRQTFFKLTCLVCLLKVIGVVSIAGASPYEYRKYEDGFFAFNYPTKTKVSHPAPAVLTLSNSNGSFGLEMRNIGASSAGSVLLLQLLAKWYAAQMLQALVVLDEKESAADFQGVKAGVYTSTYRKGRELKRLQVTAVPVDSAICYLVLVAPERTWDLAFADYTMIRDSIRLKAIPPLFIPTTESAPETDAVQAPQAGTGTCAFCSVASTQPASQAAANPLVGVWFKETADLSSFQRLKLTLRPDGTYTKESWMRMSAYGTGYIPGRHDGTWRSSGSVVYLSGDGNYPASNHDLSGFERLH
jgi:hypothetical protein